MSSPWALSRGDWLPGVIRSVDLDLPGGPRAVGQARREVLAALQDELEEQERRDVELLVSELVSNSVRHGGMTSDRDRISVHAALTAERLRLEVCDSGPGFPAGRPQLRDFEEGGGGLGLVLLDRMSAAWGVAVEDRVCVWAEFERTGVREVDAA